MLPVCAVQCGTINQMVSITLRLWAYLGAPTIPLLPYCATKAFSPPPRSRGFPVYSYVYMYNGTSIWH